MELSRFIYRDRFLLTIILLAAILRLNNFSFGYPALYLSNDEASLHFSALNMLVHKSIFTSGNYGPLGAYIQIPFIILSFVVMFLDGNIKNFGEFKLLIASHEGYFLFIPRILSALFSILSIFVIFKLSILIFKDKKSALWSSFLFAVSFNLVHISHFARSWTEAIFFVLLSCYFIIKSTQEKMHENKNIILSFFFLAIAFGFHQIAGLAIIFILLIKYLTVHNINLFFKKTWHAVLIYILVIFSFNYISLGVDILNVLLPNPHVGLINIPLNKKSFMDFLNYYFASGSLKRISMDLFKTDFVLFLFSIIFFFRNLNKSYIYKAFLLFIIFNFLLIITIFPPFLRYFLISISLMTIFAGFQISRIAFNRFYVSLAIILFSLLLPTYWNFLITRESTYRQVENWINYNISNKAYLAVTERRSLSYTPATNITETIRSFDPGYYSTISSIIKNDYPDNVRNVIYIGEFRKSSKKENLQVAMKFFPISYVVDSYLGSYDRLWSQSENSNWQLIAHFSPTPGKILNYKIPELMFDAPYVFPIFTIDRAGPYFDVIRIKREDTAVSSL